MPSFKILIIAVTLAASPVFAAEDPEFAAGVALERAGQFDSAYSHLDRVDPGSERFVDALTEMQKLHFRSGDWQKFFGFALFYREKFLNTPDRAKKYFRLRPFSLESVALAKHCHWEDARQIAIGAEEFAPLLSANDKSELDEVRAFLGLKQAFSDKDNAAAATEKPHVLFNTRRYWKVRASTVMALDHPRNLRVPVTSLCNTEKPR